MSTLILMRKFGRRPNKIEIKQDPSLNPQTEYASFRTLSQQQAKRTCRLCLTDGGSNLFPGSGESYLARHIYELFDIQIFKNDGKPQYICGSCEGTVQDAAKLKLTAEITQWRLDQGHKIEVYPEDSCDQNEHCTDELIDQKPIIKLEKDVVTVSNKQEDMKDEETKVSTIKSFHRAKRCLKCRLICRTETEYLNHNCQNKKAKVAGKKAVVRKKLKPDADVKSEENTETAQTKRCNKCCKTFPNEDLLKTHTCDKLDKRFVCETCGKQLSSNEGLRLHRNIHTGALPFPCEFCSYKARTRPALRSHRRTHTGEKPYSCPHCPSTFNNRSGRRRHVETHLPPQYHCEQCSKPFRSKRRLADHIQALHSNAKPHVCKLCGRAFTTRKLVRRHEVDKHKLPKKPIGYSKSCTPEDDTKLPVITSAC